MWEANRFGLSEACDSATLLGKHDKSKIDSSAYLGAERTAIKTAIQEGGLIEKRVLIEGLSQFEWFGK